MCEPDSCGIFIAHLASAIDHNLKRAIAHSLFFPVRTEQNQRRFPQFTACSPLYTSIPCAVSGNPIGLALRWIGRSNRTRVATIERIRLAHRRLVTAVRAHRVVHLDRTPVRDRAPRTPAPMSAGRSTRCSASRHRNASDDPRQWRCRLLLKRDAYLGHDAAPLFEVLGQQPIWIVIGEQRRAEPGREPSGVRPADHEAMQTQPQRSAAFTRPARCQAA
jgi:hypothetical protein